MQILVVGTVRVPTLLGLVRTCVSQTGVMTSTAPTAGSEVIQWDSRETQLALSYWTQFAPHASKLGTRMIFVPKTPVKNAARRGTPLRFAERGNQASTHSPLRAMCSATSFFEGRRPHDRLPL